MLARLENPSLSALRAGFRMIAALEEFNQERIGKDRPPIAMGAGIHRGDLILGNVGSPRRMEYTVMGDTVNTASRIEGVTKKIGVPLPVSQAILDQAGSDHFSWDRSWPVKLKGKSEPLRLYAPFEKT